MSTEKYEWKDLFQDEVIGTYDTFEQLHDAVLSSGEVTPNFVKMKKDLEETGEFTYCSKLYQVKKIPA